MKKLLTWFSLEVANLTVYRFGIFIWMCHGLLPLIVMFVWSKVVDGQESSVMSKEDVFNYFIAVYLVGQIIASPAVGILDRDIRRGWLSYALLRPMSPFWDPYFKKMAYLVLCFPVVIAPFILYFIYDMNMPLQNFGQVGLFTLSLLLAHLINYNRQYAMGLTAFWTDKTSAASGVWESIHFVASGAYAPLLLYPEAIQKALLFTPFPYVVGVPANIYIGRYSIEQALSLVGVQFFWLVFFILLRRFLWSKGLRRYTADGI